MSETSDPADLYERLTEEGVFEESDDGRLDFTEAFSATRSECRETVSALDDAERAEAVEEFVAESQVDAENVDDDTLADAMAVYETCDTLDRESSVYVALSFQRSESAQSEPIPEGFLSLTAEEIDSFMAQYPVSILYFWREDCEPCAAVKDHFETMIEREMIPDEVGLGAVYGPDYARTIQEEYDVGAAPTVLYCTSDGIESRYVGNPGGDALAHELEIVLEDARA